MVAGVPSSDAEVAVAGDEEAATAACGQAAAACGWAAVACAEGDVEKVAYGGAAACGWAAAARRAERG